MNRTGLPVFLLLLGIVAVGARSEDSQVRHATENVIFVMTDGLRWQEVFGGADETIWSATNNGIKNPGALKAAYVRKTAEERRTVLMPFVWGVMAKQGQILGNKAKGSNVRVSNGMNFSYPGYSETLCGFADPRIDSNAYAPNPNITVLEWLNRKPSFHGRVAAFCAWDAFDRILNRARCDFPVNSGFAPVANNDKSAVVDLLNKLKSEVPRIWEEEPVDAIEFHLALEYLKTKRPRILFVSLGETDEWAHDGKYDEYLRSAQRADLFVKTLWDTAQEMPEFKGKTTLIFSTDHGRGRSPQSWRGHGKNIGGAEDIWMAFLGPDTEALGERTSGPEFVQAQMAATLAAFLGEDFVPEGRKVGAPIRCVLHP